MKTPAAFALLSSSLLTFSSPNSVAASSDDFNDQHCQAPQSWQSFKSITMPDGNDFNSSSNCEFHAWSWQMFMWLMQEDPHNTGQPRFLGFKTPYDLLGVENRESLLPRMAKSSDAKALDEYLQAGTEGLLVDRQGKPVYYSQYLNPEFVDFVSEHDLTNYKSVQKIDPSLSFDINVAEFKASWKIVDATTANSGQYFVTRQPVYKLVNKGGQIVVDITQQSNEYLALVGFHIAGVVKGHPEMIWATFEHKDNAPNVCSKPQNSYDDPCPVVQNIDPNQIVSERDWTFYSANTKYKECNLNYSVSGRLTLDEKSQTLSPSTQVCRRYAWGNDATQATFKAPTNIRVVQQLNHSVDDLLASKDFALPQNRQWLKNYFEVSAIWFAQANALKPGQTLATNVDDKGQQLLIGGLHLSNATIETFTQTQSTMDNCFRCHNSSQRFPPNGSHKLSPLKPTNLNISHAFMNMYFWDQEMKQYVKENLAKKGEK
ncbi:hypothetical protein [Pseudoalteromonas ruthenica]|uniref:hypothetical protein n=1 Tax=Pseudoalteromonas ruthenica TaxID=151081 RepID=UPI00241E0006|nr:hypothetical protein [Pseudoalteromonas ruthenica]|tara:strand:+ start:42602 stop:44062 length:1461 start_codon:yes stop_codon:yes gene_type:complete